MAKTQNDNAKEQETDRQKSARLLAQLKMATLSRTPVKTKQATTLAQSYGEEAIHMLAMKAGLIVDENGAQVGVARTDTAQIMALNSLLDRAYGKAKESHAFESVNNTLVLTAGLSVKECAELYSRMLHGEIVPVDEPAAPEPILLNPEPAE